MMKFTDENGREYEVYHDKLPPDVEWVAVVPVEPEEEKPWPQEGDVVKQALTGAIALLLWLACTALLIHLTGALVYIR